LVVSEQASIAKKCNIQFQGKPGGQLKKSPPPSRDRAEGEESLIRQSPARQILLRTLSGS
jgi:hypothetical protein